MRVGVVQIEKSFGEIHDPEKEIDQIDKKFVYSQIHHPDFSDYLIRCGEDFVR